MPHLRLQGHAAHDAARPILPRPAQPCDRDRAGAGALALQHQHVPELGSCAPVPLRGPQRRDQHGARQLELDARPGGALRGGTVRRGHRQDQPDHQPERQRLRHARQHARAALSRGPLAAARDDDDGPGAVVRPPGDGRRQAGLLPVPLEPDGAMGRSRRDRVHRRQADRRRARPQRPATLALLRHDGRPGDHGVRGGRARHTARQRRAEGPAAAGPHVPGGHRAGPHHRRRGDQADDLCPAALPPVAGRVPDPPRRPARRARVACPGSRDAAAAPGRVRLHVRGRTHRAHADGARRRRGRGLDGQRHAARGAVVEAAAAVRLFQAALRTGDEPADRLHPRGAHHLRRDAPRFGGQPAEPAAIGLPPPRTEVADRHERGVREDPPHGPARTARRRSAHPVPRDTRREGPREVDGGAAADGAAPDRGGRGQRDRAERSRREQGVRARCRR